MNAVEWMIEHTRKMDGPRKSLCQLAKWVLWPPPVDELLTGWKNLDPDGSIYGVPDDVLEPNAFAQVLGPFPNWTHKFKPEIAKLLYDYLRVSGLLSIKRDFAKLNEACDRLESVIGWYKMREKNLNGSIAGLMAQNLRLEEELALERLVKVTD